MKNSCIAIILAASAFTGSAQVDFGHNYVREITPGRPYAAGSSTQLVLADSSTMVTSRYFDGIGRQVLEVQRGVGRGGHDVGRMLEYDLAGKVSRAWVPVGLPGSDGGYASADEVRSGAAEIYGDDVNAFSEVFYEFNALKRPWYEIMPGGKAASRHPSYTHYFPNDSTGERACRLLKVDYDGKLTVTGFYRPCGLGIKSTTDADGRTTMEFEDTQGRVVLIRRSTGEAGRPYAETYFVYDIYNNLRVAVSPEAAMQLPDRGDVDGAILDDLCQQFRYDVLNRRIWAKAPGCEPEYRVYGPLDLPLMVQLPAQRAKDEWTVFKYDHLFRKVMEGTVTCRTPHTQLIEMYADSLFTEHVVPGHSEVEYGLQYSHRSGPSGFKALRAWYYDDYSFALNCPTVSDATFSSDFASSALGLCTGSAVIDGGIGLYTAIRYDDYDRPVASVQWNPFGNGDFITELKAYDFRGNVVRRKVIWEKMAEWTALSRREANWRTAYDVANRPLSVDFSPDGQAWTTLGAYTYDDAGRIVRIDGACQEVFARNVRGQITSLSSGPLFRQYISYEDLADSVPHSHTGIPTKIREKGFGAENTFSIAYDGLGRLVGYSNPTGSIQENIEYDLNTNPTGILRRYNDVVVQDAAITYSGNQIAAITDAGSDALAGKVPAWTAGYYENPIEYDAAGRPLSDTSRGISSIKYHSWGDCISRVDFTSGNRLTMTYRPDGFLKARRYDRYRTTLTPRVDANGDTTWRSVRKLESSNIQSYAGPFETTNGSTTVQTGFGHWSYADSTHVWYARDFRGSVRNTVQINPSTGRKQMAAHMFFYPSGLPVKVAGAWRTDRIYQDKEWIDGDGVGWYERRPHLRPHRHAFPHPRRQVDRRHRQRPLHLLPGQPAYRLGPDRLQD